MAFSFNTTNKIQEWLLDYFDRDVTSIRDCANAPHRSGSCGLIYTDKINQFYKDFLVDVWESLDNYSHEIGQKLGDTIKDRCEQDDIFSHDTFVESIATFVVTLEANNILNSLVETEDEEEEEDEE